MPSHVDLAAIIREAEEQLAACDKIGMFTGRRLVAVCKAAVEMVDAENDFRAFYGFTGADTARVLERRFAAFAALDAAVRGEAGGEKG